MIEPDGVTRDELGRVGEGEAARFYERLGYRVEARNLRIGRVEIDLVLRRGGEVVFCEVKTRRGGTHGLPEEAVNARKQTRLLRAAEGYLARRPAVGSVRFDVMSVASRPSGAVELRHLPDAFRPW